MEATPAIQTEVKASRLPGLLFSALVFVLILLAFVPIVYANLYTNRVFPGVQVLGVPLGGMSYDEARSALSQPIANREGVLIVLRYGDKRWTTSAAELGLRYDLEATLAHAFEVGRGQGFLADSRQRFAMLTQSTTVEPVVSTDPVRVLDFMHRLAKDIDQPMQNASLRIENVQAVATPARTGYRLDTAASSALVAQALASEKPPDVPLVVSVQQPMVTDESISEATKTVQKLISAPITISFSGRDWVVANGAAQARDIAKTWTIDRPQLAQAVVLDQKKDGDKVVVSARLDSDKFIPSFSTIAKDINRKVQDARFDLDVRTMRLAATQASQEGRTVDVNENVKRLVSAAAGDTRAISLAVAITKPAVAADQGDKLGIKEQVAQGVTTFAGSSAARTHNIRLAADKIDGAIIAPNATFSLLDALGPITAEAGYQPGYAIVGDFTVQDIGGGVCQVATTVFRAAFWAGLPMVERNAHRYIVDRYFIKGGPVGLDAAIYDPGRDLVFKNNTGNYLILKTDTSDPANFTATLYGTKPGWTVTMDDPVTTPGKAHGPQLADVEDPTLPVGTRVLAQPPVDGLNVSLVRVVKQGSNVLSRDTIKTAYQPAALQYVIGTKK